MVTIGEVIARLLPNGSNLGAKGSVRSCPIWPPDLFAVAGALIYRSGFYAELPATAGWDKTKYLFGKSYKGDVEKIAKKWAETSIPPERLERLWGDLLKRSHLNPIDTRDKWHDAAMRLMAIADCAATGVGFRPEDPTDYFPTLLYDEHVKVISGRKSKILPYLPSSLCSAVPIDSACVQPKTMVPDVGCTLRSLSHNLALLPPKNIVDTSWLLMAPEKEGEGPLNLLLIPYPFVIDANDFLAHRPNKDRDGFFSFRAGWRDKDGRLVNAKKIADSICLLLASAKRETANIHGVVLPETALTQTQASQVAAELARRDKRLELFISGIKSRETKTKTARNSAYTARLYQGRILGHWLQSKHHRWGLDEGQIVRYHLGSVLDPEVKWWEKIDVSKRTCKFTVIRSGASLAVLVCEDLARADPVLPVVNSVGPNLLITLLMDGPQLDFRWPSRYATVLADDPGSSVLTLTSLGMVRRSTMPGEPDCRVIALWKEHDRAAQQLTLPKDDHALLLSLVSSYEEQTTLDRRDDGRTTQRFRLAAARGVKFDARKKPKWLRLD